jgi:hypothetical protein
VKALPKDKIGLSVEKQEDPIQQMLTRRIVILRQVGALYRRTDEVHHQRLFNVETLVEFLSQNGFRVDITNQYEQFSLPPAHIVLIAHKPI